VQIVQQKSIGIMKRKKTQDKKFQKKTSKSRAGRRIDNILVEKSVLEFLRQNQNFAYKQRDIISQLSNSPSHEKTIMASLKELVEKGQVRKVLGKRYTFAAKSESIYTGKLDMAEGGFGFIRVDDADVVDIFISASGLNNARHGDRVEVEVISKGRNGRLKGVINSVIERSTVPLIGRLIKVFPKGGLVYPDNPRVPGPVEIPEAKLGDAKDGDRVQVELQESRNILLGKVVEIFGPADDAETRFKSLIVQFGFRPQFSNEALAQAESAVEEISEEEIAGGREDIRDLMVVTIDPESAHDYDDALSLTKLDKNFYELGVHIADVAWYVAEGSALDQEAIKRATSVYSSHGNIPMLPERLSSDLCSLREGVDRRAVSVFMKINLNGEIFESRVARTAINSDRRYTYGEVQEIIENDSERRETELPAFRKNSRPVLISYLLHITNNLRKTRFESGGLNLEVPEYDPLFDENGRVAGFEQSKILESNHLVEECMLAANKAVTEIFVHNKSDGPKAFLYRLHDRPNPEKLSNLADFVQSLEMEWTLGFDFETITSRQINVWLESLGDHPMVEAIRIHTLRSMAKANYGIENIGHYGLGFTNYTHFTSPIRRYPDITVHRILLADLKGKTKYGGDKIENLKKICEISSERERAAQEFERESMKIRRAEYFHNMIGEEVDGMIVSSVPKGIFISLIGTGAQGMIDYDDLGPYYFERGIQNYVEIGSGVILYPGTILRVKILSADPDTGRIELEKMD
jgi:ribonuclease R